MAAGRLTLSLLCVLGVAAMSHAADPVRLTSWQLAAPVCRAQRPTSVVASLENTSGAPLTVQAELTLPAGVRLATGAAAATTTLPPLQTGQVTWQVVADTAGPATLGLRLTAPGQAVLQTPLAVDFLPAVAITHPPYIPAPQPVQKKLLIGAHNCPLWEADKPAMWDNVLKHPERTPALGFYDQANPEVSDWETKWAVEHGVDYFIYCWYRSSQGGPVTQSFGSAIHEGLAKAKFADKLKFTIMWENQSRGRAGVSDERDLLENLLPFWIREYFKHPSYLVLDNRPVLYIYRPEFLVQDLGGEDKVAQAFDKMRQACRAAGFDGLYLLGEYRGLDPNHLKLMQRIGLDYTFAYCWYVGNSPQPPAAIAAQQAMIQKTQELAILPQVVTVSQGWTGWHDEGSIWRLPPKDFATLLRWAKDYVATLPANQLGSRMLLLDNWNEWGEGHFLAPYREYGFGYLDAVRDVFAPDAGPHTDLLPEDVGRGPYDQAFWQHRAEQERDARLASTLVRKPGGDAAGLVAWWTFDEPDGTPAAYDWTGHGRGGALHQATRATGVDGSALVCAGGSATVASRPEFACPDGVTVSCWVKTDVAAQDNHWLVNRVYGGGTDTGYRLGILGGKPCFEVPQTEWSHHLSADIALPTGRWVQLAGTFDGKVLCLYVDGVLHGQMDRPGPVKPNTLPITLGSYERGHAAYFRGLLDEVKLFSRALSAEEVLAEAQRALPGK